MKRKVSYILLIIFSLPCLKVFAQTQEDYLAIFLEGKKVGYAVNTREVLDDKVKTTTQMTITLSRGQMPITIGITATCLETTKGEPLAFESRQQMSIVQMTVSGTIEPNGMMLKKTGNVTERQKWLQGALLSEGLLLLQKEKGLKKGTAYKAKVFEPSSTDVYEVNFIIGDKKPVDLLGRVVSLTEIRTTMINPLAGEVETVSFVDDDYVTQKSETPIMGMNLVLIACPKEFALGPPEVLDLIDKMIILSPRPINNIQQAESITYYLSPKNQTDLKMTSSVKDVIKLESIPSTDIQTVSKTADGVVVKVSPVPMPENVKIPYAGSDQKIIDYLKPSRFIQSDNEKIKALAKKAVGNTTDAAQAAKRIEDFVSKYVVNKNLSVGYASAVEVADSKEGDCSEFAVLTAALCRAAGIPAQVVVGIAYVSEWQGNKNCFGGHAWTQAYIGDKWVGLDSAFKSTGRGGFDAGHIALAVGDGDPEDFFKLVSTFGLFKIDKIQIIAKK